MTPKKDSAKILRRSAKILQIAIYFPLKATLWLSGTRYHVTNFELQSGKSYIIAANHNSELDPFVLTSALPFRQFLKLLPFRYIASNRHLGIWYYRMVMLPFGSFPAREHPTMSHGIEASNSILQQGQTLVIFPEGKMNGGTRLPAKRGIEALSRDEKRLILPVYLEKTGRKYRVITGQPFSGLDMKAEDIQDKVYALNTGTMKS